MSRTGSACLLMAFVLFSSPANSAPLAKLAGVYKAAKALQLNLASEEKTLETVSQNLDALNLELALAADLISTEAERQALRAYEQARDASKEAASALARWRGNREGTLRAVEQHARLRQKLGMEADVAGIMREFEPETNRLREQLDQAVANAQSALDAAHARYINRPVPVRKVKQN